MNAEQAKTLTADDAGNAQTNFVNYALAQTATQTYVSGDLGAYLQAAASERGLVFAGGFRAATNLTGSTITTRGVAGGKEACFLGVRWAPKWPRAVFTLRATATF